MKAIKDETIKKVIDGDARAFEVLYNQTYSMAKNIALSLVHNEYDAEDIIQDSYIKLLKNLPNITNTNSLFSYFTLREKVCQVCWFYLTNEGGFATMGYITPKRER